MAKKEEVTTVKASEKVNAFSLPKTKVHVKPILRSGRWLPDGHSGSFMYDNTSMAIQVPIDKNTGGLKNPLTKEEQEFFEGKEGFDMERGKLNSHRTKENFWKDFAVHVRKNDDIVNDKTILLTLDLSDPIQYIQYKVLMTNSVRDGGLVAPSWNERFASGTYRVALVHEGQQSRDKVKRADMMQKAYKYVGKIEHSAEEMFDFLTVYYLQNAKSKRPSQDSDKDFYKSEIQELLDTDLNGVIAVIDDADNYEYKLLVHRGIKIGALKMVQGDKIETVDGTPLGNNLTQAVQWLKDDRHQDEYLRLKNQIELN